MNYNYIPYLVGLGVIVILGIIFRIALPLRNKAGATNESLGITSKENPSLEKVQANDNSSFASYLDGLSYIVLIAGIIGCLIVLFTATWVEVPKPDYYYLTERVFSPAGFGTALGLLFSGIIFYSLLGAAARILRELK
ncbi:MAG: hypothetical protein FWC60_07250 [Firmicutes bacterium]|nr:hypothetical protein [Bacillota bacterium]